MKFLTDTWKYVSGTELPDGGDAAAFAFAAAIDPEGAKRNAPDWYTGSWMETVFDAIGGSLSWVTNLIADWFGHDIPDILTKTANELPNLASTVDAQISDTIVDQSISKAAEIIKGQYSGLARFSAPDVNQIALETHDSVQLAVEEVFVKGKLKEAGVNVENYTYEQINEWLAGNNDYQKLQNAAAEFANKFSDSAQIAISSGDISKLDISGTIPSYAGAATAMTSIKTRADELFAHTTTINGNSFFKALELTQQQTYGAAKAVDDGHGQTDAASKLITAELTAAGTFTEDEYKKAFEALNDEQKADLELIKSDIDDFDITTHAAGGPLKASVLLQGNGKEVLVNIR